jgi:hypothetical protein
MDREIDDRRGGIGSTDMSDLEGMDGNESPLAQMTDIDELSEVIGAVELRMLDDEDNDILRDKLRTAVARLERAHDLAAAVELDAKERVLGWMMKWIDVHGFDATLEMMEARRQAVLARLPPLDDEV